MIVDKDTHPQNKLYYWGALVIELLHKSSTVEIDYLNLYEKLKQNYPISMEIFALTLDWLFILGIIDKGEGCIKKCF